MTQRRRIAAFVFPDSMILDATGPLQVFASANDELRRQGRPPAYDIELLGLEGGPLQTSSGLRLYVDRAIADVDGGDLDTLLIAGGAGIDAQCQRADVLAWLRAVEPRVRRVGSVCSGALLLAAAGLLDGRVATTHWSRADELARQHPAVTVDVDRLHTYDPAAGADHVFTSAGVTAGIDLALALIEHDCGQTLALAVARRLVMFLKRPGGQTQFSAYLAPALERAPRLAQLLEWVPANLNADLSLEALAERAGMSPRTFSRVFTREVGITPGRYVERVRVEVARLQLQEGSRSVSAVARSCGFGHAETMRRAFQRQLGVSPQEYAARFGHRAIA